MRKKIQYWFAFSTPEDSEPLERLAINDLVNDSHARSSPVYGRGADASVVQASVSEQLQANPHVVGPWLSHGKPTRRAVIRVESQDLVVGEDHMLGQSCQRHN